MSLRHPVTECTCASEIEQTVSSLRNLIPRQIIFAKEPLIIGFFCGK